ncbi:hypothetical protein QYE76_035402 [Lolium multiflorum]|uniref:Uncharacterized protein n=1 Tax=Lolium multiflorum TaxID=4521 RepID=A0AAD8R2G0_LOLMU|nr:hypothetical protein QYE76_035402 [Lolium multiflorum]
MLKNELIKQKERNIASAEKASSILKTVCLERDKSDIEYKILLQDKVQLQKLNLEYADIAILALLERQKAQDKLMHLMLESCSEREETLKEATAHAEDASTVVAVAVGEASPGTQAARLLSLVGFFDPAEMGVPAVTTGEFTGTHAARLLCLSGSSTSVETGVLAVEQKVDTNVVYPAEDVHGVAGHHGEVFLGPMLDANLDPFDDFGPNVQFQEDVEGDDEEEYSDDMDNNKVRRDRKSRYVLKRLKGGEIRFRMRGELFCPLCGKFL